MAPVKKPGSQAAGLNLVVTTASLALTLGGWGLITANEMEAAPPEPAPIAQPLPSESPAAALALTPIPTLVPLRELTIPARQPAAPARQPAAPARQPAAAPRQPAAPARQPAAAPRQPAPAPQPVTRSRSSQ